MSICPGRERTGWRSCGSTLSKTRKRKVLINVTVQVSAEVLFDGHLNCVYAKGTSVEQPLVSIIIPVYNTEQYVGEALESAVGQSYKNLEILVIDDGSEDASGRICDEYQRRDPRVRVIHQENRGLSVARNLGLRMMTGELVAFLDSDDRYYPNMIEAMVRKMEETGSDLSICCDERHFVAVRPSSLWGGVYSSREVFRFYLESRIPACVWDKVFRRKLWDGIEFPEGRCYEDTAIIHKLLLRAGRICLLRDRLVFYRTRQGSITKDVTAKNAKDFIWAMNRMSKYASLHPESFTEEERNGIERYKLRKLVKQYSHLYQINPRESVEARNIIRTAILSYRKKVKILRFKERVALRTAVVCPSLIPGMVRIYWSICRISSRLRRRDKSHPRFC